MVAAVTFEILLGDSSDRSQFYQLLGDGAVTQVRFILTAGDSAISSKATLLTNYTLDQPFDRAKFYEYNFKLSEDGDARLELPFSHPGIYDYRVQSGADVVYHAGHLLVPPKLPIPLSGINLITLVSKWLGNVQSWPDQLQAISRAGYNMVHFAPLQVRGMSNSPYSIGDQLSFSPDNFAPNTSREERITKLQTFLTHLETNLGILAMSDVVWNHTAHSSAWLREHPEAGYNLKACPHLKMAYALDEAILLFSTTLANAKLDVIKDEGDIVTLVQAFETKCLAKLKLWEFLTINVDAAISQFTAARIAQQFKGLVNAHNASLDFAAKVKLLQNSVFSDPEHLGERHSLKINLDVAFTLLSSAYTESEKDDHLETELRQLIDAVNIVPYRKYDDLAQRILLNIQSRLRYERLDEHGPKKGKIDNNNPLVDTYFTRLPVPADAKDPHEYILVNNGWIYNADPLIDFASSQSDAYVARDVIVWGDCVKLRYGTKPEDNPWLWSHMTQYTEMLASMFHAIRIDNCHSTPIHVGQYLLDKARKVRPNLFIMAELFAGSEDRDAIFVSSLGLHVLIREGLAAWSPQELSRILYRVCPTPIGAFSLHPQTLPLAVLQGGDIVHTLKPSTPSSLFVDCTHDNQIPADLRAVLPLTALVSFLPCPIGSVRGWDDLFPAHLNVVSESRLYQQLDADVVPTTALKIMEELLSPSATAHFNIPATVVDHGIYPVRALLSAFHRFMIDQSYVEAYVHQDHNILSIHRQNPETNEGFLLIAHTAFIEALEEPQSQPTVLNGLYVKFVCAAQIKLTRPYEPTHTDTATTIRGARSTLKFYATAESAEELYKQTSNTTETIIQLKKFPPGSILIFRTSLTKQHAQAFQELRTKLNIDGLLWQLNSHPQSPLPDTVAAMSGLNLLDLNVVLYRSDVEERDSTGNEFGEYNVPGLGGLGYCGLQGVAARMTMITKTNDMGHPLLNHMREGLWLLDYLVNRLDCYRKWGYDSSALIPVRNWLAERFDLVKRVPKSLQLCAFAVVILQAYEAARARAFSLMSPFVQQGGSFVKDLSLTSIQLYSLVPSASLSPYKNTPTLAAGLPFFATRHMRCWGRDTFMAIRGLLLVTGRLAEARENILSFGSCVRHGLIPNLLDSGRFPRYNCRDAVWWWLFSVQEYIRMAPEGTAFLQMPLPRLFPTDDAVIPPSESDCITCTLAELIQEVLQRHASGIHFRERNAGSNLDSHMTNEGFNVDAYVNWGSGTGFVQGGNRFNCGTWMDKMGESDKAGNKGQPATPRDGSAVELVGLLKATIRWLSELHAKGLFPNEGVTLPDNTVINRVVRSTISYSEWNQLVQAAFERHFFIPNDPLLDTEYHVVAQFATRRGIYRDTYGSSGSNYVDQQLRPNFLVTMVVAPELFNPENARLALNTASVLLGPLGMKTLDPADWNYHGSYDNSNDSGDHAIAHGFNYHQGPEWLWLTGFYLRALRNFGVHKSDGVIIQPDAVTSQYVMALLQPHRHLIATSSWAGLPELTNESGKECRDACPTQAWSSATLLETLYDLI